MLFPERKGSSSVLSATAIPRLATSPSFTFRDADAIGWNAFLARTPGGSYQQTSLWGLAKLAVGYRTQRFVLEDGNAIIGGAQLLIRPLPLGLSVAYIPLGPILGSGSLEFINNLLERIHWIAERHKITYLAVQAPRGQEAITAKLQTLGFSPSLVDVAPNASVVLDLSQSLDALLAKMHKTTRYDIKAAQRKGITVRQGSENDLGVLQRLLFATASRQHFRTLSQKYLSEVWRLFSRGQHIKMFVAEFDGQPVSAAAMMAFGDTVTYWKGGWSGEHGNRYPNEALQWTAVQWAKGQGYRYYDFGGIPRALAKAVLGGESIRKQGNYNVGFFKLGFGGQVELFPQALSHVYHPLLRRIWSAVSKATSRLPRVKDFLNKVR
jgi:lipid II:glycine glycyltransferase (peptidoglycan interpeptide bridge formation enzyme)